MLAKLGTFDLDPCSPINRPWDTAKIHYTVEDDGLKKSWENFRVWLNPPYGSQLKHWLRKMAIHGNGIALVPARTEVESWFWPYVWQASDAILFMRGRLYFYKIDGTKAGNAGHGSVLVAYGEENVKQLANCGIVGRLVLN